jgi:hypothetical protein
VILLGLDGCYIHIYLKYIETYYEKRCIMKKIKFLAIALALSLSVAMLACGQPVGYVSDNNEAAQTVISLLASPPAVTSVTETAFDTDTTDHYVNMPATVNVCDLLIVLFTNDGSATAATPGGWSSLASDVNGSAVRLSVYYKIAAGTEGGTTVNLVTSAAEQAAAQVYRITDWNGTTPPEISTAATGTVTRPDPASLNLAGWDVADTLWLAVAGQDRGDQLGTTAYPVHYTDGTSTLSSSGTANCRTLSAHRVRATASENPGAFTIPVSEEWVAFTIAVRPGPRDLTISISTTDGGSVTTPGEGVFTYDEGTVVDLVATPDAGYWFVEWTGDVGTIDDVHAAETTITMNDDCAITANFAVIHDLTISSTGGGSVTEPGEGVFTYDEGILVDLVATPDEGYRFDRWTGDVGTIADVYDATTTIITMNGDYSITANFIKQYDLTTSSTGGGSVIEPGEGVFTYDEETVVGLVATPGAGCRFVEWTGDVGTIADVYDATTTITMNGDYAVTANFVAIYDLTVSSTAGGNVTTPGQGTFTYDAGTVVNLVATPDEGYRFVEWTGDVGTIADVYDATTTITMNGDYAITANFVATYDLTISSTEAGSVTQPGEGVFTYDTGTVVNLVATPGEGYRFVEWTGDVGTIADVYDASTNITMNGDYSITANFVRQYNLTISSTAGGNVTTPGVGTFTYDTGTVVNLVATPAAGYRFVNWTGNVGTIGNVNAAATNITMNGDYSITANFVRQYTLTITSTAGGSVTTPGQGTFTYDAATVVSLVATPDAGYRFVNWTGDLSTIANVNSATTTITMNGDYAITANFVAIYDLTISSTEGGSVTIPGQGRHTYDKGEVVNLVATPASGYRFVNWTGSVGTIADVYDATTTITMNGDYAIIANFIGPIIAYSPMYTSLWISSTEGGSVTTPGEGWLSCVASTVVVLVASPDPGYRFVNWSGDVAAIADVYDASTTITMNSNYSITANFVAIYDLSIASTKGVSAIEPGEGVFTYDGGTVVDLVAEAEEGYRFIEWTGDVGTIADVYAAETTITMNGDYSITANFEEVPPSQVYPTVTTQAATNITTSSTTLNMSYTVGDFSPVEVRFAYKKSTDSAWSYTAWVSKTADGTHAEVLTGGLDFNTTYDFKSRLKYNGTVVGGTTLQFTTDTPSPSGSGGCFIATAAYGTPTAKQIDLLREFRDVVLLKSTVGSQFVALYYQVSPPIADFIAGNELLTTLVRELLVDPIVWIVEARADIWRN